MREGVDDEESDGLWLVVGDEVRVGKKDGMDDSMAGPLAAPLPRYTP